MHLTKDSIGEKLVDTLTGDIFVITAFKDDVTENRCVCIEREGDPRGVLEMFIMDDGRQFATHKYPRFISVERARALNLLPPDPIVMESRIELTNYGSGDVVTLPDLDIGEALTPYAGRRVRVTVEVL